MTHINDVTIFIPVTNLDGFWKGSFKDLPPNKIYELIIDYPLSVKAKFKIHTGKNGLGLIKLLGIIGKKYIHIYENPRQYGIWGHVIDDLQLEGITVNHKKKTIELSMGS